MQTIELYRQQSHSLIACCKPVPAIYFWISDETGTKTGENLLVEINRADKKTARNRLILCRNLSRV